MNRIGVRYIDRVHGARLEHLAKFIRPEVIGIYTSVHQEKISRATSELSASTNAGQMTARWGFIPPNQTYEQDVMPPIDSQSWFLDTLAKGHQKVKFDKVANVHGFPNKHYKVVEG